VGDGREEMIGGGGASRDAQEGLGGTYVPTRLTTKVKKKKERNKRTRSLEIARRREGAAHPGIEGYKSTTHRCWNLLGEFWDWSITFLFFFLNIHLFHLIPSSVA
jgi:hypothetical protein